MTCSVFFGVVSLTGWPVRWWRGVRQGEMGACRTIILELKPGYYAMSGTSQKNSKIQKFNNEKKNISPVQLTNAAISLLN